MGVELLILVLSDYDWFLFCVLYLCAYKLVCCTFIKACGDLRRDFG